jgi:hypothetical protein
VLSLRSVVIAFLASAAIVVVLAGVIAGVFTAPTDPQPIPQSAPGELHAPGAPARADGPRPADIPGPADAPRSAEAPRAAHAPGTVGAQPPAGASPAGPHPVTVHQEPVVKPVHAMPTVVAAPPMPMIPVENRRPASPPPSSASREPDSKSRTVNTEPCSCDGQLRKVSTHWEPATAQG